MRQLKPKYISIESQSDIDSSDSQTESIQIETNSRTLTKPIIVEDMYQKFTFSKFYLLTESLKKYANQINDFLQMKKNVLFIFGPSGCGKGTLVKKILAHNSILYDTIQQYQNDSDRIVSLGDSIIETLQKQDSLRVHICYDFPIHVQKWNFNQIRQFKKQFNEVIKSTTIKLIFILNEEIYNSFYVLNERAGSEMNLNNRDNVGVVKMEKFGVLEIKRILKGFVEYQKLQHYVTLGKDFLDEVVELANGDLRKALYMLYWKGVQSKAQKILKGQKTPTTNAALKRPQFVHLQSYENSNSIIQEINNCRPKSKSSCFKNNNDQQQLSGFSAIVNSANRKVKLDKYEQFMKNKSLPQSRFSLYHGLGKLLYGKRLNIKTNPKNKKDISCYYTERQIKDLDPPFYFDPVGLFDQLRIDLDIVTKLLQQNYLQRYGKIKDIRKMSEIFVMQDGFYSFNHKIEDEQVRDIKVCLLTWGMLIYNRNSRTDNLRFMRIEKSQSTNVDKKVGQKQRLIKQYFPQSHMHDILAFGHLTRSTSSLLNDIIFNKSLSRHQITKFDDHTKNIQNQAQQEQIEAVMKMTSNEIENKLRQMTKDKEKKQKEVRQMLMEMEEEDDENMDHISSSEDSQT